LQADSDFVRDDLMVWCEEKGMPEPPMSSIDPASPSMFERLNLTSGGRRPQDTQVSRYCTTISSDSDPYANVV
jgi:hypothetical protein